MGQTLSFRQLLNIRKQAPKVCLSVLERNASRGQLVGLVCWTTSKRCSSNTSLNWSKTAEFLGGTCNWTALYIQAMICLIESMLLTKRRKSSQVDSVAVFKSLVGKLMVEWMALNKTCSWLHVVDTKYWDLACLTSFWYSQRQSLSIPRDTWSLSFFHLHSAFLFPCVMAQAVLLSQRSGLIFVEVCFRGVMGSTLFMQMYWKDMTNSSGHRSMSSLSMEYNSLHLQAATNYPAVEEVMEKCREHRFCHKRSGHIFKYNGKVIWNTSVSYLYSRYRKAMWDD